MLAIFTTNFFSYFTINFFFVRMKHIPNVSNFVPDSCSELEKSFLSILTFADFLSRDLSNARVNITSGCFSNFEKLHTL